jgi:hypothetical protein
MELRSHSIRLKYYSVPSSREDNVLVLGEFKGRNGVTMEVTDFLVDALAHDFDALLATQVPEFEQTVGARREEGCSIRTQADALYHV